MMRQIGITVLILVLTVVPAVVVQAAGVIYSENFDVGTTPGQTVLSAPLSWGRADNGDVKIGAGLHDGWVGNAIDGSTTTGGSSGSPGDCYFRKVLPIWNGNIIVLKAKAWAASCPNATYYSSIGFGKEGDVSGAVVSWMADHAEYNRWCFWPVGSSPVWITAPAFGNTTVNLAIYVNMATGKTWGTISDGTTIVRTADFNLNGRPYSVWMHQNMWGKYQNPPKPWGYGLDVDDIVVSTTYSPIAPAVPVNLAAVAVNEGRIDLSWTDQSSNETGFLIERGYAATGPFAQVGEVAANVKTFSNTGLNSFTTYYYRIRAHIDNISFSNYSNSASVATPPIGVPDKLTYQGKLTTPAGSPVADDSYALVIKVYDEETGGNLLWTSQSMTITTSGGLFTALVEGVPPVAFPSNTTVWMEAMVNTETLSPRKIVGWVPFAMRAGTRTLDSWTLDNIMITSYKTPPADTCLCTYASDHYNLTWSQVESLDAVQGQGLKALLQDSLLNPGALDNTGQKANLDALVDRVKYHPAMEGYYIQDEPGASEFAGLGRLVSYLRGRDPAHFSYINLFPTYASEGQLGVNADTAAPLPSDFLLLNGVTAGDRTVKAYWEYLHQFVNTVHPKLLSYDHYHFFSTGDGTQYFLNLWLVRRAALDEHVPFLNIIQACVIVPSWRQVNGNELRWLVYTTLAYGGRGISYFIHWGLPPSYGGGLYQDGVRTSLADSAAGLNAEMAALSPELMQLDSTGVYHTSPLPYGGQAIPASSPVKVVSSGGFVLGLFAKSGQVTSFMVVNRDYASTVTCQFTVPSDVPALDEYNRQSKTWVRYSAPVGGIYSVALQPGDGRLFRFVR